MKNKLISAMLTLGLVVAGGWYLSGRHDLIARFMGHDMGGGMAADGQHAHGADGMGHDEATMPGLMGADATPEESAELATLFRNFTTLTRTVENLPDGIRTVTSSSDPDVMAALVSHVAGMTSRVAALDDPEIIIQSPTLDIFFVRGEGIETEIEVTEAGIIVVQTSTDAEVVAALQTHAAEVSAMAARGMDAVHEMMAARGGN